eukprot:scaffold12231_cov79-Phaeocystis_antarctica.AAC.2
MAVSGSVVSSCILAMCRLSIAPRNPSVLPSFQPVSRCRRSYHIVAPPLNERLVSTQSWLWAVRSVVARQVCVVAC